MTDFSSTHDRLVAAAQAGLQELTDTLEKKINSLGELAVGRSTEQQERIQAKIAGVSLGLTIAQQAVSSTTAYLEMNEVLSTVSSAAERSGLEVAIQDARLISRL